MSWLLMLFAEKLPLVLRKTLSPNKSQYHPVVQQISSVISLLHLALFYFDGKYLKPYQRLLSITYKSAVASDSNINPNETPNDQPGTGYEVLGLITALQALCRIFLSAPNWAKNILDTTEDINMPMEASASHDSLKPASERKPKCLVCFEEAYHGDPILGPCGHIICWTCMVKCLSTLDVKADFPCPLCRFSGWNISNIFPVYI